MSEVKVNKISPRSGTEVTLGDSGDTFTIPSGATINNQGTATNFGATGSASWVTTVKTGDFTAVAGEGYFVNTTSGEIDVTLPAGTPGAVVAVKDYANTWDTNNCIIISNGSEKIGGSTNNAILSTEGLAVTLIYIDSTQGWLVTDDGTQSVAVTNPFLVATGGTITNTPTCRIHTFTGPGTFTVSKIASCAANNILSHIILGGGGGGAGGSSNEGGGGGGAGGYREVKNPVTPYTASPLDGYPSAPNRITVTVQAYPIAVGGGGPGGNGGPGTPDENGTKGVDSSFGGITAAGGGFGGRGNGPGQCAGGPGGSGGGGGAYSNPGGTGNTPPVSPAQGNNGGTGFSGSPGYASGAGGGAGAVGGNGTAPQAGAGGTGTTSSINETPTARAGGGGGGAHPGGTGGAGGSGGGGQGSNGPNGTAGTVNTGGGGGGSGGGSGDGGGGGSGIVIIRYKIA
jgi:hypothetical protein